KAPCAPRPSKRDEAHDRGPPPLLCRTVAAAGSSEPAGAVVAVARDAAAAAPNRISADPAAVRHQAEGRNPVADAMVADAAAPDGGGTHYSRRRRPDLEPTDRRGRQQGA